MTQALGMEVTSGPGAITQLGKDGLLVNAINGTESSAPSSSVSEREQPRGASI
jgi:hypothetical protein